MKNINKNLDIIESLLYFWQATSENEKVGEQYFNDIKSNELMKYVYDEEFNEESFRKVLSAISNREPFSSDIKKERVFWNNNMWMTEDLEFTNMMLKPIKVLNLDALVNQVNESVDKSKYDTVNIILVPGNDFIYKIDENNLVINFFKIMVDIYDTDKITIDQKPLVEYIKERLIEIES